MSATRKLSPCKFCGAFIWWSHNDALNKWIAHNDDTAGTNHNCKTNNTNTQQTTSGKKIIDCKYGCGARLQWNDDIAGYMDLATGNKHSCPNLNNTTTTHLGDPSPKQQQATASHTTTAANSNTTLLTEIKHLILTQITEEKETRISIDGISEMLSAINQNIVTQTQVLLRILDANEKTEMYTRKYAVSLEEKVNNQPLPKSDKTATKMSGLDDKIRQLNNDDPEWNTHIKSRDQEIDAALHEQERIDEQDDGAFDSDAPESL